MRLDDWVTLYNGDALETLGELPDESVQCCVTRPPYWGLRDYGQDGQLGLEPTPDEYVERMVGIFREVRRVLRADGTLWLNLGDSYAMSGLPGGNPSRHGGELRSQAAPRAVPPNLKPKDLVGIPWRVAFALQADGWYLRSDIIWSKPNPMPESVTDRPTKAHEYVFLLSKSARYFYDADAIAEPVSEDMAERARRGHTRGNGRRDMSRNDAVSLVAGPILGGTRNKRTVWTITTKPYAEAHFATFPPELPTLCIKAGTSREGCCPECGTPWERIRERVSTGKRYSTGKSKAKNDAGLVTGFSGYDDGSSAPVFKTTGWEPSCDCEQHEDEPGVFIERPDEPTDRWVYNPVPCTVLDPFAGAGTTLYVAKEHNRHAIGIELNPDYCKLIERRLAQGVLGL